jgi:hypothetical protein
MKYSKNSEDLIDVIRETFDLNNIIQIKNPHDPFSDLNVKYWHKCFTNCGDVDGIMLHNLNDSDWINLEPQLKEAITYIEKQFEILLEVHKSRNRNHIWNITIELPQEDED